MYEAVLALQDGVNEPLEELDRSPAVMPEFIHIWEWFEDLNRMRGIGFQVLPLNCSDIANYYKLMKIDAHPEETRLLMLMDQIYLSVISENQKG